jgi:hypothetical protein
MLRYNFASIGWAAFQASFEGKYRSDALTVKEATEKFVRSLSAPSQQTL